MANNSKLREQARALEQRENWREAIALYRQVIENPDGEEVDIGLWNRLGDLHLRLNETERAVEAYEAAVNAYAEVALHNNAIALCRKILRLVPGRASVYLKLGQISAAKGFLADARQNFLEYAERMQRAGKLDASFAALKEFADLSPSDTDVRRLLADQLLSHGHPDESIEQLRILVGQAEEKGAEAVAEELREQIRSIDPNADTSGIARASHAGGGDDFASAFDSGALHLDTGPAASAPPSTAPPSGMDAGPPALELDDIAPLEGLETTNLAPEPEAPAAPVPGLDLGDFSLDHAGADPLPAHDPPFDGFGFPSADDEDYEGDAEPLPLMDDGGFGGARGGLPALETPFDRFSEDEDEEAEPLPLMDVAPVSPPRRDRLEELRERFAAAPGDVVVLDALLAELDARGQGYEAPALLEEAHRGLAARGMYAEALPVVSRLVAQRPGDAALLQKQVEYAFRSGDRERLVPAYLALGAHLVAAGEEAKGRAVFQRVLELDPSNAEARAAVAPAPAPRPGAPAKAAADEYIDLGSLIMEDEPQGTSTRFVVEEKEPTGDEDRDFADMLSHFRQKVAENIEVEDSASHYDLGTAFKEMGLLDEAIAEFQVALRGGANPLATLEMLGQCFVEKGQYAVASRVLDRALRITGAGENELIGVLYQLGRATEAVGEGDAARGYYERVMAMDIRFRDAAARADALRGSAPARPL
ncbi:MAG TPA: tetratricopeptide repeat protein [Longimicrobiaceae bacterium]|jgi:tetratricopeptide (TPR) repeat protein|nr:tetratricopeptide repeat protein [Longimicrobiaceae bacterium]